MSSTPEPGRPAASDDGMAPRGVPDQWPAEWTGDALEVAPRLLGCVVVHAGVAVVLTEVEAYRGDEDPASHAFRGQTVRNAAMFGPAGHLYVYLSYGIHRAANIVTTPEGVASGVLLRAGRVVAGLAIARGRRPGVADDRLCRGPGNLGRALALDLSDSGRGFAVATDLDAALQLAAAGSTGLAIVPGAPAGVTRSGPRVGVGAAHDEPWRFWLADEPSVSAYRRQPPGRRARPVVRP